MILSLIITATLAASAGAPTLDHPTFQTGAEVVQAMHDRYAGKWYRTFTFVQTTTFPNGSTQTWYEAMEFPGKLRIDIAPLEDRNSLIFRNDTLFRLTGGTVANTIPRVHPLLLLGFDVYFLPVEETLAKLTAMGVDLTQVHSTTWQGRPTIVVGAATGDSTSHQFWIDEERLVFVRLLEPMPGNRGMADTQFNRYEPLGKGWIAPEVRFFQGGQPTITEEYREMKIGMAFESTLFVPTPWTPAGWITP